MANEEHVRIIKQGVAAWNDWRNVNSEIEPDLSGADLSGANLIGADLNDASLYLADLNGALLNGALLRNVDLGGANLSKADLSGADIRWANISEADLSGANLSGANLVGANLSETNFEFADLTGCHIYAISAWNLKINENTKQSNLIITRPDESTVTVDNLEVAQFVHLLLNHQKIRNIIDTITSKSVLILGRFTPERKVILDAMADELRKYNLIPIIFDFERATSRDFTETIKTLAGMSLFVIADITNPKSAPLELQATIPDYQIPFVPIIEEGEEPFSMFADLKGKYGWVLKPLKYPSWDHLKQVFKVAIIDEAFKMHKKLLKAKAERMKTRSVEDYLKN